MSDPMDDPHDFMPPAYPFIGALYLEQASEADRAMEARIKELTAERGVDDGVWHGVELVPSAILDMQPDFERLRLSGRHTPGSLDRAR